MTVRSTNAFVLSTGLHALVIAVLFLLSYVSGGPPEKITRVIELVAGPGDNYNATVAPKLGTPEGIKLDVPKPPAPKPEPANVEPAPPEPVRPASAPIAPPPPVAETAVTPQPPKTRTMAQELRHQQILAELRAKKQVAKERDAEKKRQAQLTKEEFDKASKAKAAAASNAAPPKVAKIDTEGIKKGVVGGSIENKIGGAGGKALTADEASEVDRYTSMLQQRLKDELDQTPGLDDGLRAEAEVHIMADGRLTRAQITKSSGNDAFDNAVRHAIAAVRMPPRPKGLSELQTIPFSTREKIRPNL